MILYDQLRMNVGLLNKHVEICIISIRGSEAGLASLFVRLYYRSWLSFHSRTWITEGNRKYETCWKHDQSDNLRAGTKKKQSKKLDPQHTLYKILFTDPITPSPSHHSSLASYSRQTGGQLSKTGLPFPNISPWRHSCYSGAPVPFASSEGISETTGTPFGASSTTTSPSSSSSLSSSGCLNYFIRISQN